MKRLRTVSLFLVIMLSAAYASTTLSMNRYLGFEVLNPKDNDLTEEELIRGRKKVNLFFEKKINTLPKLTNNKAKRELEWLRESIEDYRKHYNPKDIQPVRLPELASNSDDDSDDSKRNNQPVKLPKLFSNTAKRKRQRNKGSRNLRRYMAPIKNNQPVKLPEIFPNSDDDSDDSIEKL